MSKLNFWFFLIWIHQLHKVGKRVGFQGLSYQSTIRGSARVDPGKKTTAFKGWFQRTLLFFYFDLYLSKRVGRFKGIIRWMVQFKYKPTT